MLVLSNYVLPEQEIREMFYILTSRICLKYFLSVYFLHQAILPCFTLCLVKIYSNCCIIFYWSISSIYYYIQPKKALLTLNVGRSGIPVPVTRRKKSLPPSRDRSYERSSPTSPRRPFRAPSHAPSRGPSRSRNLTRSTSETPPTRLPPISRF